MSSHTTLALVLLVAFAGCVGPPSAGTPTQTPTPTPTDAQTPPPASATSTDAGTGTEPGTTGPTTYSTADCPALVSVDPVSDVPDDATVIPYGDLSESRRAEFDEALTEGRAAVEDGGDGYAFWVDRPYVRHEGTVYRAVVSVC